MDLAEITQGMKDRLGDNPALKTKVKFDFGNDGLIAIDTTQSPPLVSNDDMDANCTVLVSFDNFKDIIAGDLNAQMAFMTGKLRVEGDMGVAMQLGSILG